MKKTIIILLILSICVALFACNRTENNESSDKPKDESSAFVDDSSTVIDESAEPIVVENVPTLSARVQLQDSQQRVLLFNFCQVSC